VTTPGCQKTDSINQVHEMSSAEINQVLAQMRVIRAQVTDTVTPAVQPAEGGFHDLLQRSIDKVNATQQTANAQREAFEQGEDVDLASVMIAAQKSSVAFQAMAEVRNKLVEAYKDVMNMPV
jgi:flagellar hook-basal body complex protein FliE